MRDTATHAERDMSSIGVNRHSASGGQPLSAKKVRKGDETLLSSFCKLLILWYAREDSNLWTFCSGSSRSLLRSITYINHRFCSPLHFLRISAPFVTCWWGIWWVVKARQSE